MQTNLVTEYWRARYLSKDAIDELYQDIDAHGVAWSSMEGAAFVFQTAEYGTSSCFWVEVWRGARCVASQSVKGCDDAWSMFENRRGVFFKAVYHALRDAAYSFDNVNDYRTTALDTLLCAVVFANELSKRA